MNKLLLLALAPGSAAAILAMAAWTGFPVFTVFEKDHPPGPLTGDGGWEARHGGAEVAPGAGLRLAASWPPAIAQRVLSPEAEADVLFLETALRPAAGDGLALGTRITAGTAGVGFSLRDSGEAALLARDGFTGEWVDTGVSVPMGRDGRAAGFHRLTLRLDRRAGVYDLFWDGVMVDFDLGMPPPLASGPLVFRVTGAAAGETWVEDFLASEHNPLHPDTLGTGIPDDWLRARGLDPARTDRYAETTPGGAWLIEEYFAELRPDARPAEARSRVNGTSRPLPSGTGLMVFTPLERPRLTTAKRNSRTNGSH